MLTPKQIRQALGELTTSYSLPSLIRMGLISGLVVLALGATRKADMAGFWALFGLGGLLLLGTFAGVVAIVVRKPELLRSEKATLIHTALDIFGDDTIGDIGQERVERTVTRYIETDQEKPGRSENLRRKGSSPPKSDETHPGQDGDNE